jgi:hypothetical protein
MTLAAAIQAQMLQTLLSAMQAADQPLKAGATVRATFAGWAGPDGQPPAPGESARAEAVIGQQRVSLLLTADAARIRSLLPGAGMVLSVDQAPRDGAPAQVRLTAITPASAVAAQDGASGAGDLARRPRAPSAPEIAPPAPLNPALAARAAAGPLIGAALARQDSLAPLFANLTALASAAADPGLAARTAALPRPVLAAAERVLAQQLPVTQVGVTADALKQAVARSGIFHEAELARGQPAAAAGDLKSALLILRATLQAAAGDAPPAPLARREPEPAQARAEPAAAAAALPARPAPPVRDGLPTPQPPASATIDVAGEAAGAVLAKLGEQTGAALDRLSLNQFASLPAPQDATQGAMLNRWFAEVPLALGAQAAVLPLEIEEDRSGAAGDGPEARLWRVRFALDLEPMGLIHALVAMQGKAVSVAVWAERESTSRLVRDFAPDLQAALEEEAFDKAEVAVATGRPAQHPAAAGRYLDRVS